jgi:hypothetical protein
MTSEMLKELKAAEDTLAEYDSPDWDTNLDGCMLDVQHVKDMLTSIIEDIESNNNVEVIAFGTRTQ